VTWFFSDLARFKAEREALESFGLTHEWFVFVGWRLDERMRLVLYADIVAGGKTWPIYLQFPQFYPDAPPSVFPRGDDSRWSYHQYGAGGELCLEYGPDNWTPDLTGVEVIESAYRLLQGENPAPGETGTVASRHSESLGRTLRSKTLRFLMTRAATEAFAEVKGDEIRSGVCVYCYHKDAIVFVPRSLTSATDGSEWTNPDVPKQLGDEYFKRDFALLRLGEQAALPPTETSAGFRQATGLAADAGPVVLVLQGQASHAFYVMEDSVCEVSVIPAEAEARRTDAIFDSLKDKKVALVGCGSLGGKIGAMLTRAGVNKWLLADDDLLMPDNFVRNELDWRDAGSHKASALARRMEYINPAVDTSVWHTQLGMQTASESAETIMRLLGECDLIIDATANPDALNIVSAVAKAKKKSVIWGEVFGGGIGGLMARYRPGLEPPPSLMRRAIENWFRDQSASPVRSARSYETGAEEAPLIANDADVTTIAAHTARFAIDLLARPASSFPHSVYAIGLGVGSAFTEPFDTRPIDVGQAPAETPQQQLGEAEAQAELAKLIGYLQPKTDEPAAAPPDNQAPAA
jgi:molybdopterin/thiamine biosynthesis adenylyltransferase